MGRVYNVLSLDGCGFRGRTQLLVLEQLMKKFGNLNGKPARPCDVFDLICGTATGGLIAILVGRLGMSCDEAITAYDKLERSIFEDSQGTPFDIVDLMTRHQPFDIKTFRETMRDKVEGCNPKPGQDVEQRFLMSITDEYTKKCKTFVTVIPQKAAFDNDAGRIRSYSDPPGSPDIIVGYDWQIQDAAVATALCPRLFEPKKIPDPVLGDSAPPHFLQAANMSGFSNPSMIAYSEALTLFGGNAEITLISLGMGLRNRPDEDSQDAAASEKAINQMIGQLGIPGVGVDPTGEDVKAPPGVNVGRLREFIRQTQLVATTTHTKHLRLADLTSRISGQLYYRLDPQRNGRPFILVDYVQTTLADEVANDSFKDPSLPWDDAVNALKRSKASAWQWRELPGFSSDAPAVPDPPKGMTSESTQIMQKCYEWEKTKNKDKDEKDKEFISCFTIDDGNVKLMTGPIQALPGDLDKQTLFVRVLLDDRWRFFPQLKATNGSQWPCLTEVADDSADPADDPGPYMDLINDPIKVIRTAQADLSIKAINSQGFYVRDVTVTAEQVKVPDSGLHLPFHGTWIQHS